MYVFIELNPGTALGKIDDPFKFDETSIILLTPNIFSKKATDTTKGSLAKAAIKDLIRRGVRWI